MTRTNDIGCGDQGSRRETTAESLLDKTMRLREAAWNSSGENHCYVERLARALCALAVPERGSQPARSLPWARYIGQAVMVSVAPITALSNDEIAARSAADPFGRISRHDQNPDRTDACIGCGRPLELCRNIISAGAKTWACSEACWHDGEVSRAKTAASWTRTAKPRHDGVRSMGPDQLDRQREILVAGHSSRSAPTRTNCLA